MLSQGADWSVPLLRASEEVRRFMLTYRPSGEMDERGITTHVARLAKDFGDSGAWPGLTLKYDAKLAGEGGEKVHGADYEVTLKGGGLLATFRLQAKRLYPARNGPGRYKVLEHESGPEKTRQVDLLLGKTRKTANAGYIFYNALEESVADVSSGCCLRVPENVYGLGGLGLTLAAASEIERRWGKTKFEEIFPISVPATCLARCGRLLPGNDARHLYFRRGLQPWELPLFAAVAWSELEVPEWRGARVAQLIQTADEIAPLARELLQRFSPLVQVSRDGAPEYLQQLSDTGRVELDGDGRPADVLMLLDADQAADLPQ